MSTVRIRRLEADFDKLADYIDRHPRLTLLEALGDPPETYRIELRIHSLRQIDGELRKAKKHEIEIHLPRNYPRTAPQCRMLTPVFHPNIAPHAICVGDHWSAGEPLWSIVSRIGEMLAYQSYNVKSPLNGEAARWVQENADELPMDPVSLLAEESATATATTAAPATSGRQSAPPPPPPRTPSPPRREPARRPTARPDNNRDDVVDYVPPDSKISIECDGCGTKYRVPANLSGKRARCKNCQSLIPIP